MSTHKYTNEQEKSQLQWICEIDEDESNSIMKFNTRTRISDLEYLCARGYATKTTKQNIHSWNLVVKNWEREQTTKFTR
jgi:hypothetical protein